MALAWALVAAPLVHRLSHEHGEQHQHGSVPTLPHGAGSFEHQSVIGLAASPAPVVIALVSLVSQVVPLIPARVDVEPVRLVARAQAP